MRCSFKFKTNTCARCQTCLLTSPMPEAVSTLSLDFGSPHLGPRLWSDTQSRLPHICESTSFSNRCLISEHVSDFQEEFGGMQGMITLTEPNTWVDSNNMYLSRVTSQEEIEGGFFLQRHSDVSTDGPNPRPPGLKFLPTCSSGEQAKLFPLL